jgi:hypothetical protein
MCFLGPLVLYYQLGFFRSVSFSFLLFSEAGLPDGIFSDQKITIWVNFWRALEWKSLVYSIEIWNILHPFGTFYGYLVI